MIKDGWVPVAMPDIEYREVDLDELATRKVDREAFMPGVSVPLPTNKPAWMCTRDDVEMAISVLVKLRVAIVLGHTEEARQLAAEAKRLVDEVTV